ncbi:hypothetical protein M441DRAFT_65239 [Trichoderma asperellum CBS 433.97]|uniref:Uncharacterized protein n=1 Tax=Trichoderma asperellum (strain ATCC 204424 / CBS 433.97 / NBRC 101777) TaxID=1042311 RepID=A0A2T3ZLC3_TRIA4|nr:hypothetical protein M441DRAFT_65239 [Trichoderma asperellum CBS 433.97]PTB45583.1 hypothetical protein M441DRAFT_65239 [Trichoderma asperellum CBS 433.97]
MLPLTSHVNKPLNGLNEDTDAERQKEYSVKKCTQKGCTCPSKRQVFWWRSWMLGYLRETHQLLCSSEYPGRGGGRTMTATKATTNPIKSLSYKRISNNLSSNVNLSYIMERIRDQRKRMRIKSGFASRLERLVIWKRGEKHTNELRHEERKRNGYRRE